MWAIGLNKGWVEVRVGLSAPIPNRSKVVRIVEIPKNVVNADTGAWGGKQDLIMEVTCWEGGRVVSVVPRQKYLLLAKGFGDAAPKTGGIVELNAKAKESFKSKAWRKEMGIDNGA